MHNIYGDHSGYATFCTADRCGVAVFLESRLGMDDLVVDGITVSAELMVKGSDGRMLWPILCEGISRITVNSPAIAGEKVWVNYETGKTDGQWFEGAIRCTNMVFLTDGHQPLVLIEQGGPSVPPPDYYVPFEGTLDDYTLSKDFEGRTGIRNGYFQ